MPVTKIKSRWDSGNLIFHESSSLATIANVLTIGTGDVTIGSATNDVNFKIFLGDANTYALFDCGAPLITFAAVDVALSGDLTVTLEDISVAQGKFIYTEGQAGASYIVSDTAGDLKLNTTTNMDFALGGTDEVSLTANCFAPAVTDGCALGSTTYYWSDLFIASAGVINFNNDVTLTHATDLLTFAGGNLRLGTTDRLEFRDATEYMYSSADGQIDIVAATTVAISGAITGDTTLAVTSTDATAAGVNAIFGDNAAGAVWTSGNQVGVRGRTTITGSNNYVSATGVWAGLVMTAPTGSGSGLTCALNAEVSSSNSTVPNAVVYIQSLPGASANFSDVPYLVFSETRGGGAGTGSRYLFEVGHAAAGTIPEIGTGELFYESTLQIAVNETEGSRTNFFIPLSTIEASFTTDMPIVSSSTSGYSNTAALDPNSTRSNHAFAYGWRGDANEVTATFENDTNQHLEPIAINLDIAGANPSATSTVNVIYQNLTHDTIDMAAIRLKQADWYISIKKDVLDVYNMQLETAFGAASIAVGGEMAVMGLVLDGGSNEVSCNAWRVINCTLRGSGSPAGAHGIMVNAESSLVVDAGVMVTGDGMQVGYRCGTTSYANSPVHFAGFPAAGTQPVSSGADASGDVEGSIAIKIGAITKYLHYWPNAA